MLTILEPQRLIVHRKSIYLPEYIFIFTYSAYISILEQGCSLDKNRQTFNMNIYVVAPMMPGGITGRKFWNLTTQNTENTQNIEHTETFKIRIHNSDSQSSFLKIPITSQMFRIFEPRDCLLLAH